MSEPPQTGRGLDDRARLAAAFKQARRDAGLSGAQTARLIGSGQSKISKIERGALLPSVEDVRALSSAYHLDAGVRDELVALTLGLREEQRSRLVLSRRVGELQHRIGELERSATHIRSFQPMMVIGTFQTPAYAQTIFAQPDSQQLSDGEVEDAVAGRMKRQTILSDPAKHVHAVVTEGSLLWHAGSPQVMVEQLDHLTEISRLPNVRLGIIPWTRPVNFFPRHGFHIYDEDVVSFGTETAFATLTSPADVAQYVELFAALEASAAYDDDARENLTRIADRYRTLLH